jgi:hypothetical protein
LRYENQADFAPVRSDNDLKNIEFKLRSSSLVYDFEEGLKSPEHLSLAVVWENDLSDEHANFQVIDIEHSVDADRRVPAVNHVLLHRHTGRAIQLLVVKDVINAAR